MPQWKSRTIKLTSYVGFNLKLLLRQFVVQALPKKLSCIFKAECKGSCAHFTNEEGGLDCFEFCQTLHAVIFIG